MTSAALPPANVPGFLAALCPQVRGVAVETVDGTLLAGDPDVARAAAGSAAGAHDTSEGRLHVASDDRHVVAVRTAPGALDAVVAEDLRSVLADLAGR